MVNFYGYELPSIRDVDNEENPLAIAHLTNGEWDWYVLGGEELEGGDLYLFGLVNGIEKELGFFTFKEILKYGAIFDENYSPMGVFDIYPDFDLRR